ncbi:MAG: alpha/beta hydrolase [Thermosynechococcaceae cyanobacterium]
MSSICEALWVNTSASLQRFDQPLLQYLATSVGVAHWAYRQTSDEPSDLEIPVQLLHEYLQEQDRPLHLIGHGTSGLVALLVVRQFPEYVRSLTLLGVGAQASLDWIAHYYFHLKFLGCCREQLFYQLITDLFGRQNPAGYQYLGQILRQALATSPSPHSMIRTATVPKGGVTVPFLACGGHDDVVVSPHEIEGWRRELKECDRIYHCPHGRHFFHSTHPQIVGPQILAFWNEVSLQTMPSWFEIAPALAINCRL